MTTQQILENLRSAWRTGLASEPGKLFTKAVAPVAASTRHSRPGVALWTSLGLVPVAAAGAAAFKLEGDRRARVRRAMRWKIGAMVVGGAALGAGLFRWQMARLFAEEPAYVVESRLGPIELRRYAPLVVAETKIEGRAWREALNEGFRRLAGYIFGGNAARERISMSAPVMSGVQHSSEKLAMNTPVTATGTDSSGFTIAFAMPKGRAVSSLPLPHDTRVKLREIPERRVAALRYSGSYDADQLQAKQQELLATVEHAGLTARYAPAFAGYDPPSTIPFLRRQEVWVEVSGPFSQLPADVLARAETKAPADTRAH